MASANLTVALAGNPNSGKTTIFNNITGARQHVGNYPGVTVEKREGYRQFQGKEILVVDLPGTYSLTANALDELVARNVIINDNPDMIVNILDASNLERNLYLSVQLLELGQPMVLALNMTDVAEKMGVTVQVEALQAKLGVQVVHTVGNRNRGTDDLLQVVVAAAAKGQQQPFAVDYGPELEKRITQLIHCLTAFTTVQYPQRWLAIKLLENDNEINKLLASLAGGERLLATAAKVRAELKAVYHEEPELTIAKQRYAFVGEVCRAAMAVNQQQNQTWSDKIDTVLTNRLLGLPIFLGIMWLLFNLVFTVGSVPQEWIQNGADWLGAWAGPYLGEGELKSLLIDGIIGGVGTVVSFLPQILLLFLGIALLEDTGYMARAAFVMDRVMAAAGLHGKSFIPLLLGFGCNIPAVMGTRTLENPRDRMVTLLVSPLMSCSARLPIYVLLTSAFFSSQSAGTVLFSIYLAGIMLAVCMAFLFRKLLFSGETEPFVMEMPQYHLPTLRSILTHMWERSLLYLKKAGSIILAMAVLTWVLLNYPSQVENGKDFEQLQHERDAAFSRQVTEQVLAPLNLTELADNDALAALISQIGELKSAPSAEDSHVEKDNGAADEQAADAVDGQLAALEQAEPALFPYALAYWQLEQEHEAALAKLDKDKAAERLANSYAGRLGHLLEPAIKPLGFDWKMGVSLFAGFAAKEVTVSTMGTVYSVGKATEDDTADLQAALTAEDSFSPLVAYCFMVFALIYTPCMATVAVIRRETNSWRWAGFSVGYSLALAWIVTFAVYRAGLLLGY